MDSFDSAPLHALTDEQIERLAAAFVDEFGPNLTHAQFNDVVFPRAANIWNPSASCGFPFSSQPESQHCPEPSLRILRRSGVEEHRAHNDIRDDASKNRRNRRNHCAPTHDVVEQISPGRRTHSRFVGSIGSSVPGRDAAARRFPHTSSPHTFATKMLKDGMTLNDVRLLLGHASIQTTQRYQHLESGDAPPKAVEILNRQNVARSRAKIKLA